MKKSLRIACLSTILAYLIHSHEIVAQVAQFNTLPSTGCAPLTAQFYNASSAAGTYTWNFGDPGSGVNNTSSACSPVHTYNQPGNYTVTLTVNTPSGPVSTTGTVTVHPSPVPVISGRDTICQNLMETYSVSSIPGNTYQWSIQGGTILTAVNTSSVQVIWNNTGAGTITVAQTNAFGCKGTATKKVLVVPPPSIANFCSKRREGGGSTGGQPQPDKLGDQGCVCAYDMDTLQVPSASSFYTYTWSITGGSLVSGQGGPNPVFQWGAGPTAVITVIASSPFGCNDTATCILDICKGPKASFTATTVCLGSVTQFNATASTVSNQIVAYQWDFGDFSQQTTTSPMVGHLYASAGTYSVRLRVTYGGNCSDDTIIQVTVKPGQAPPITCISTVCHGTKHCYSTPFFPGASYAWNVTGGTFSVVAPGDSICVVWGAGPVGTISVTVTGGPYTCASNSVTVPVFPAAPQIIGPDTACVGIRNVYTAPHIPGTCYSWTVNGNPIQPINASGNMISWKPATPGVYTIAVTMDNEIVCCKGTATKQVVVQGSFSIMGPQVSCPNNTLTYSILPAHSVTWQVSGGTVLSFTGSTITVQWGSGPIGQISAVTSQPNQFCDDRVVVGVNIWPAPPNPAITGPAVVCRGSSGTYAYIPLPAITSSSWSITPASGVITNLVNANTYQVQFNATGNYTIQTTYTNSLGCNANSSIAITVLDTALPAITGPLAACAGSSYTYSIPSNPGGIYTWSVIGGTITAGMGTASIVVQWGNISQGQVIVQNSLCGGIRIRKVQINALPNGPISLKDTTCAGTSITLVAPPGFTYQWGHGPTTQQTGISTPGNYWVILNNGVCQDTAFINLNPIPKYPKPLLSITAAPTLSPYCPKVWQMTATFNPQWTYQWTPTGSTTNQAFSNVHNSTHTVIATTAKGCKDTQQVTISTNCASGPGSPGTCQHNSTLSINYNQCTGQFTSTGSNIAALYWNFGDGTYSNQPNPIKYYSSLGPKTIKVDVLDVFGCWSSVPYTFNIVVNSILRPKIRHQFNVPCNYTLASFSQAPGSVLLSSSTITHSWYFGQTGWTANTASATFNYPNSANTWYTWNVVSDAWCTDTTRDTVVVRPFKAQFFSCGGCSGQPVQLVDNSTSYYPVVNWNWNFGDGNNSNLPNPFHIYGLPGTYNATLTITNSQGCIASVTQPVIIGTFNAGVLSFSINGIPYAYTGNPIPICEGDRLVASAPIGSGWTYAWNNNVATANDTITSSGQYFVIVSNGNNCTDTLGPFTVIRNPKPFALILGDTAACSSTMLQTLATMSDTSHIWTTIPVSYTGSGYFYSVFNPGNNLVQLVVQNQFGCRDTAYKNVNILAAPVVTVTPISPPPLCQGDTVHLTAAGSPPGGTYTWNTGQSGPTVVAGYNQFYLVTYTGPNGCTAPGGAAVVVNPLPDLSIVPTGCYKVCSKQKSVQICGPGKHFGDSITTYNWYHNGNVIATTQHINITLPGTYWLWAQNQFGCISQSAPFTVQFVNPPGPIIVGPGNNPILCKGKDQELPLDVDHPEDDVIYTWYLNGEPVFTGTNFVATEPGTYVLNAYKSECCQGYDTIVISKGDCCWDSTVVYTTIQNGYVVNTSEVWNGKYYVAGKVYVRNTSVLDLTGVDVVFSRTGEIIFEDSTILRANNSVFRPCDMHDIWVGFTFLDSSQGLIHTCLYKNATTAVDIRNTAPYSVRITDDVFSDCNTGISIKRKGAYTEGITHNSFVIENTKLPYTSTSYFGIKLSDVRMEELVSQNIFRNSDKTKQGNFYHGIHAVNVSAVISANRFSNMFRSVDVSFNLDRVSLENNFIELTENGTFPNDYQVRVTDCKLPVVLHHNTFRHSAPTMGSSVAIFLSDNHAPWVHNNDITGFRDGIQAYTCKAMWINENNLDLVSRIGIFLSACNNAQVRCNTVRNKHYSNVQTGVYPVGIRAVNCNTSLQVYTNCVLDTRTAMWFSAATGTGLPDIRNNFLYNYRYAGLFIQGHTGTVGTAPSPGQNTFSSNNTGNGTPDFRVIPGPVVQGGNFGVLALTGSVLTWNPSQRYNSTAACGLQIANAPYNKLNAFNVCEQFSESIDPIDLGPGGVGIDKPKLEMLPLVQRVAQSDDQTLEMLALGLAITGHEHQLENLLSEMRVQGKLTSAREGWYRFRLHMALDQTVMAAQALHSIRAEQPEELALLATLRAEFELAVNHQHDYGQDAMHRLAQSDAARSPLAAIARDRIQSVLGGHDYLFPAEMPEEKAPDGEIYYTADAEIRLMPNPASDKVAIDYNIPVSGDVEVEVHSMKGGLQLRREVQWQQAKLWIDVSDLSPGIYLVVVRQKHAPLSMKAKLVKY